MSRGGPLMLFTDFGLEGPYVGQMKSAIYRVMPQAVILDLCHDLTPFAPRPAAYLLAALLPYLPVGACVVAVVDPGVGTARRGLVLEGSGMYLVGPDNGLLAVAAQRLDRPCWHALPPPQEALSATFQGRDWFAPAAARLQAGQEIALQALGAYPPKGSDWPSDQACVIYIDRYGNAMTGLRAKPSLSTVCWKWVADGLWMAGHSPMCRWARHSGTPIPAVWWRLP